MLLVGAAPLLLVGAAASGRADRSPSPAAGGVIRLHVVANSDARVDQELKMKVRDAVLAEVGPRLAAARTAGEARRVLREESAAVMAAARAVVRREGRDYPVRVAFFAAGTHEAVKVIIGAGAGHNWWCVAFPPTCLAAGAPGTARAPGWDGAVTAFRLRGQPAGGLEVRWALAEWWHRWRARKPLWRDHGRSQVAGHDRIS